MAFSRRSKFNSEVELLLPNFGFDVESGGLMKFLKILDIAWNNGYNIHESALFLAYCWADGFNDRKEYEEAKLYFSNTLKPVEIEWVQKGLVRSELADRWTTKLKNKMK